MKFDGINYQLLAKYMAGDCSLEEKGIIEEWAGENPENDAKLKQFKRVWKLSGHSRSIMQGLFNAEEEWDELQARLEKDREFQQMNGDAYASKLRSSSIHSTTQKFIRVAAIFLVAGIIGILSYQNWYTPDPVVEEPVLKEVRTGNAQRANLKLGDGTEVMLNAGSVVRFPNQFEEDVREVYLEGEAYFDVVSNPDKPFVIHSRGSLIRVLGTSFTVRSYSEEEQVRVVVQEGRVLFKADIANSESKAFLNADELGRYDLKNNAIETAQVDDMQLYMSWREGYLKFREEPMSRVAEELERRYGLEVVFEDSAIGQKSLTAFLKSRSIRNVLDVIAMSLNVDYRLNKDDVHFFNK